MLLSSSLITIVLITFLSIVIFLSFFKSKTNKKGKKIPGPLLGWPVIGYIPYLDAANPYLPLNKFIEKYGPIFQLPLGSWNTVFITDYHQIKKCFNSADFAFRPSTFFFDLISCQNHGLILSNGSRWVEQRRFTLRHLRDLGMGKSSIETHIQKELLAVSDLWSKQLNQPLDLNFSLNIATTNIVWAIMTGKRMEYDDPMFLNFMQILSRNIEIGSQINITAFVPWLLKIIPERLLGLDSIRDGIGSFFKYAQVVLDEHKATFDPNDEPRDFMDIFLNEQLRQGPDSTFSDTQLLTVMSDMFAAGGETTATTLRWALLLITSHPEVQKKVYAEIDQIVGKDRMPSSDDQTRMPYLTAVIYEVQRFADIAALGVTHATQYDVEFEGYIIPKDSMIMGFLGNCHHNPKFWSKPDEFYPEHFLDKDGQLRTNVEGFIPFSTGKRVCIGERLARMELFLFTCFLHQQFNFRMSDEPKPTFAADPRSGIVRWPSPYSVILEKRL